MGGVARSVFFAGKKAQRHVREGFAANDMWDVADTISAATYKVLFALAGVPSKYADMHERSDETVIAVDGNPFGITHWNNHAVSDMLMIRFGSFSPGLCRPVPCSRPKQWEAIAGAYGLPTPLRWNMRASGPVVVILTNPSGWKFKTHKQWMQTFVEVVRRVRGAYPRGELLLRYHPRTVDKCRGIIGKLEAALKDCDVRAERRSIDAAAKATKAVVSYWGTASVRYIISGGVPMFNVNPHPGDNIVDRVAFRDLSLLREMETLAPPEVSPRDFLNSLAQSTWEKSDFESGAAVSWINEVLAAAPPPEDGDERADVVD